MLSRELRMFCFHGWAVELQLFLFCHWSAVWWRCIVCHIMSGSLIGDVVNTVTSDWLLRRWRRAQWLAVRHGNQLIGRRCLGGVWFSQSALDLSRGGLSFVDVAVRVGDCYAEPGLTYFPGYSLSWPWKYSKKNVIICHQRFKDYRVNPETVYFQDQIFLRWFKWCVIGNKIIHSWKVGLVQRNVRTVQRIGLL